MQHNTQRLRARGVSADPAALASWTSFHPPRRAGAERRLAS
jgi:hypothetical protein